MSVKFSVLSGAFVGWTLDRVLAELHGAGVAGVEVLCGPRGHLETFSDSSLTALRKAADQQGLEIAGLAVSDDWRIGTPEMEHALRAAEKLQLQGARMFAQNFDPGQPVSAQLDRARRDIETLLAATRDCRAAILIEICHETLTPSPELALRVLEGFDEKRVGVVYDPGNMVGEGHLEPAFAVAILGRLLKHVHAKNKEHVRQDGSWSARFAPIDLGLVDWVKVFRTLADARYDGWVSIDHLSGEISSATFRRDIEALRAALKMSAAA